MPYINKDRRKTVLQEGKDLSTGDFNFLITTAINLYLKQKGLKYATINDILGVLEGAKLELYRRVAAPYEDIKIQENGDVY